MTFLANNLIFFIPILGLIGLVVMLVKAAWVNKQDAGEANMQELAGHVQKGAMAFLKAEWKILAYYAIIASILLAWSGYMAENQAPLIAISFLIGCFFSALAGYIGMNVATKSNVRTAQKARYNLKDALKVSFNGGTVMGLGVAGLAVFGTGALFITFYYIYVIAAGGGAEQVYGHEMAVALEVLAGFSLGAESIALFARVGGGIYTKAADVGADLVGKVEAEIPEDDPRNPATIADNVGDNVGDVAGMGADLFGSYVITIIATMVLGREIVMDTGDAFGGIAAVVLPLLIAGLGLIASIIGTSLVKINKESDSVQKALNVGNWTAIILSVIAAFGVIYWMFPAEGLSMGRDGGVAFGWGGIFGAVLVGLVVGALMTIVTEHYTSVGRRPVNNIAKQSSTGHATNIIAGIGVGLESTVLPILILAGGIVSSYAFAGLYGVGIAATSMMATTAMQLAIDAFGPIADNAGGIAEMSELPEEVRDRTDQLDSVGNTTAATGKGFAVASAALTALAMLAAFVVITNISTIDLYKAPVLAGLFIGAMIPFIFSSLCIGAVGRAAMSMVQEVRRQFKEKPGILKGEDEPDYGTCVDISTKASLREMVLPGAIALIVPIIVGFGFQGVFESAASAEILGGLLAGVTAAGVLMGIFQCNAGGAWDNAKKTIEDGIEIDGEEVGKGSEAHKASVTGDTVGDPLKDTSGPSMNIMIKLMLVTSITIAPHIIVTDNGEEAQSQNNEEKEQKVEKESAHTKGQTTDNKNVSLF